MVTPGFRDVGCEENPWTHKIKRSQAKPTDMMKSCKNCHCPIVFSWSHSQSITFGVTMYSSLVYEDIWCSPCEPRGRNVTDSPHNFW